MSHDAYIVLIAVIAIIVAAVLIGVRMSYIIQSTNFLSQQRQPEDRARAAYHGKKYTVEVIFTDGSGFQYESVMDHCYRDNMITIYFSRKYAVYIPMCNVKRLIVRPALENVSYADCEEYELEQEELANINVHDHIAGDYTIPANREGSIYDNWS